jgi:TRAP-type C4-dicarboxylate transport system permease small subunit
VASFRNVFERVLEVIVLSLVGLLAVIVFFGVAFRKLGAPLVWYDELASIMLAWLTYYGACLAALKHAHIGFPTFVERASPPVRRVMLLIREVVVIGFFALAAWTGWLVVMALDGFYMASLPWMPRQITQSVIPIGAVLFILAELLGLPELMRAQTPPVAAEDPVE